MSVTRYFYKKLEDGSMSKTPTYLGAKAEHITIQPAEGEELLNAQSEFERMWQKDTALENKINVEIKNREEAILEEAAARLEAIKAEQDARKAAIAAEQEERSKEDDKISKALATEITDRENAINAAISQEVKDRNQAIFNAIDELQLPNQLNEITNSITALKEKLLYATTTIITGDTVLNLFEEEYKYILIYCEYNGKRMPIYQVLANGTSSEIVYHSITEDGICYIGMNVLVSENTLAISNIINSNPMAEFKILSIYGCV